MNGAARRLARAGLVALVIGTGATVAFAEEMVVRPVAPPAPATNAGKAHVGAARAAAMARAARPGAAPMTAAERDFLRRRSAKQAEGTALQWLMLAPGNSQIDRSHDPLRRVPPRGRASRVLRDASGAGIHTAATSAATPDTIHEAFIRIDFLHDRGGAKSSGDGHFDLSTPDSTVVPIDRPPHDRAFYQAHAEAMKRYYETQSFGRVVFQIDVWPAEQDSAYHLSDMADLGPWVFGSGAYDAAVRMFRKMFFAADSQSTRKGDRIPWEKYQSFTMIHAGSDLQSDVRGDSPEDIPSFTVFLGDTDRVVFPDSAAWNVEYPIDRASFVPETINQDGYYGAINGVLAHENGHNNFGFLDVYDVESGYPVCGYWTLMDSGNLLGARDSLGPDNVIYAIGFLPPSIDPFQRNFISDGMDIREPVAGDTTRIVGNERSNLFYKVPLSTDEYLLMENRFQSPADSLLRLDVDSTTKVVLGPKYPDTHEYDALEPGGGILVWHVDESVIPFLRSLRVNPDYGMNTNYARLGQQIIEADGLHDLGDTGSPYLLGSPTDPYQNRINPVLADTTMPDLRPNTGTRPHLRLDFVDDAADSMHFMLRRTWALPGFPVRTDFPEGGPQLLAIDADGRGRPEVCWYGVDTVGAVSPGLYAVRADGTGLHGGPLRFATLPALAWSQVAAVSTGAGNPAVFAVSLADTSGRVCLVDTAGRELPGWPVRLPAAATTPPLVAGTWPAIAIYVGAADGYVYALGADGGTLASSGAVGVGGIDPKLVGGVTGRLACWTPTVAPAPAGATRAAGSAHRLVAAGGANGQVAVLEDDGVGGLAPLAGWPQRIGGPRFAPDFLWLRFGGEGANAEGNCSAGDPTLVVHNADRLWAFCPGGSLLHGWGRTFGDTLVAGLGAGDPDGDGFPKVLVQTQHSAVMFFNRDGYPTPGWPRAGTDENLATASPALAVDVDHDGHAEVVTLNGSGILSALRADGHTPAGWPLATGAGAAGSALVADLFGDGQLEIVAPDRDTLIYAYALHVPASGAPTNSWTMLGGDPGRSFALPVSRTPVPAVAQAGPLVGGSFKAFPNPARREPVRFAYDLSEDAAVEFRILDASGHEVASFSRHGQRSQNLEIWDPGALPAGLYIARVRFAGAHGTETAVTPVGVLR